MNETPLRRRIRFGLQVSPDPDDAVEVARSAEEAGFDVISVSDHVGPRLPPPLPLLAQLLSATKRINVGTLVLNNDMRNPVQLAWDMAWLQRMSGGRVELGLGAGHTPQEYRATGIGFDPPKVRKARLAESVEILAALFREGRVSFAGEHYHVDDAAIEAPGRPVPILVGGNGTALLEHAARHADIIGLQGLGRTRSDGFRHRVNFQPSHLDAQIATVVGACSDRPDGLTPELNALVQVAEIDDDREQALAGIVDGIEDMSFEDASTTPYLAVGTVDELARQFIEARDRWGTSYFTVRNVDWGPVIARVRELDSEYI